MPENDSPQHTKSTNGEGGPSHWTMYTLKNHIESMIEENDRRYEERFQSSQIALTTALSTQEKANTLALTAAEKAVNAALAAADRAVLKAETASEKRFDGVNEFRQTLADQQRMLMPRVEVEILMSAMRERLNGIDKVLNQQAGAQTGQKDSWGFIVGIIGVVAAIIAILTKLAG